MSQYSTRCQAEPAVGAQRSEGGQTSTRRPLDGAIVVVVRAPNREWRRRLDRRVNEGNMIVISDTVGET
jgi:hypothetical protein